MTPFVMVNEKNRSFDIFWVTMGINFLRAHQYTQQYVCMRVCYLFHFVKKTIQVATGEWHMEIHRNTVKISGAPACVQTTSEQPRTNNS